MRSPIRSLASLLAVAGSASAFQCSKDAFQNYFGDNATVVFADKVAQNGSFTPPASDIAFPDGPTGLRTLCAVEVNVSQTADSNYMFGVFLPDDWNGRFLAVGNARYAGGINWQDMGPGVNYGFATISTDTGHNGSKADTSWAYGNEDRQIDWGYRAMHGSIVYSKALVNEYYGKEFSYSYYLGCSTAGRQGLKEVDTFPDDFDGVVAGAPAWWTTHLQLMNLKTNLYNAPANASHHIPEALFTVIGDEVVKQCDPQDGVVDTIIANPRRCTFNPSTLLCGAAGRNASTCLTPAQLGTLAHIYNDWVDTNQTLVFPHHELGSEAQWTFTLGNGSDAVIESLAGYAQDFLGLGPDWSGYDLDYSTVQLSDRLNPGNATADNFDISPFQKKGGKLLHYHGLADGYIATGSSVYWRQKVEETLVPKGVDLNDFYRFFLVPGMEHCFSSPDNMNAPWYFAGGNQAPQISSSLYGVPRYRDADHDVLLSMVRWVENGTAPEQLIATKYNNDDPEQGVYRQRPLCMYPKEAKYIGTGDVDNPESWTCQSLY